MMNTTPKTATQALRLAKTAERAELILNDGYTFWSDKDSPEVIAVIKPGTTAAAYWLNMITDGCDCPDFLKHGDYCKHTVAYGIVQDNEAMWEAICAEHDAQEA